MSSLTKGLNIIVKKGDSLKKKKLSPHSQKYLTKKNEKIEKQQPTKSSPKSSTEIDETDVLLSN